MHSFEWKNEAGLQYITIPHWEKQGVSVGFSGRLGGVSHTPYNSLNLALHAGDKIDAVITNRSRYLQLLSLDPANMVCCEQIHGNSVVIVGKEHQGRGAFDYESALSGYDAMVCDQPDVALTTFYADCIPVYFFDPDRRVVAIAHSGWKGTIKRIAWETLKVMQKDFACRPENVEVFIGPGIGGCCFYIGEELVQRVKEEFCHLDGILNLNQGRYTWDLQLTNRLILQESGINPDHIIECRLCTACNSEKFFSYRRDQGRTGRMAAVIALNY